MDSIDNATKIEYLEGAYGLLESGSYHFICVAILEYHELKNGNPASDMEESMSWINRFFDWFLEQHHKAVTFGAFEFIESKGLPWWHITDTSRNQRMAFLRHLIDELKNQPDGK